MARNSLFLWHRVAPLGVPASYSLEPKENKSRVKQGKAAWCLSIPKELSPTGNRQRKFFKTKKAAFAEVEQLKARKDNFGTSLASLSPARIAQAAAAFKLLDEQKIDLLDAVRSHIQAHKQRTASVPYLELFNQYLDAKQDRNPAYLRELASTRDRFPILHDRLASDITHLDLAPLLDVISPGGRNPVMRYLRAVFFFGIKRGYLTENPVARLDFAEVKRKEIETIPSDKVEAMLVHALENDLPLLPYLVFGFFAGIRPDGELQKVEWNDIKLTEGTIVIRPEVSKTNRRRFPKISANAAAWIEAYRQQGGTFEGKVAPYSDSELRARRKANWTAARVTKWIQQGMRHTFCSNWLALNKDVNELVLQSGHDSVDTMWRNYHKGVTEVEAKKFWAIMPPQTGRNIVSFTQQH
jgi:integrase